MHQIRFRLGLRPRPRCRGSLQRSPRPLSWIWGPLRGRGRAGLGRGGKGEEKGREWGVEGEEKGGPQVTVEPGPVRALLRHCPLLHIFRLSRTLNPMIYIPVLNIINSSVDSTSVSVLTCVHAMMRTMYKTI